MGKKDPQSNGLNIKAFTAAPVAMKVTPALAFEGRGNFIEVLIICKILVKN